LSLIDAVKFSTGHVMVGLKVNDGAGVLGEYT